MSGYDAGYYSYLTSQVYSADVFDSAFAHDLANATTGRRYRHMVLEPGGVGDVMEHLERFLGRAVRTEAFYAGLGAGAGAGD
jgi:metallopeptidase MepB